MTRANQRPYASRLAIRFAIILALAMLPAGIIAFVQTNALTREFQARSEAALFGATLRVAIAETGTIRRAQGMVASLAKALPSVLGDPAVCSAIVRRVADEEPAASVAAFVPQSGLMQCSSLGKAHDLSKEPGFQTIIQSRSPTFFVDTKGNVSGTSVVGITNPVFAEDGAYLGYAVISLPHRKLAELRVAAMHAAGSFKDVSDASVVYWTFDRQGMMLTANVDIDVAQAQVPSGQPLRDFAGSEGSTFRQTSASGEMMLYAVVPIVPDELYLMSSVRPDTLVNPDYFGYSAHGPMLVMWLIGLIGSGFAAEMLVTRHIRKLNTSIVSFAHGERRLQAIELKNAPAELDELATAYVAMTDSIVRSEAQLEDTIHQKEVLLREVHHRVKNNLQLISSIMNIQMRSAHSSEAKALLKNLQERIMSLATVHRGLYQTSGLTDVRARELIPDIIRQIMSMSAGSEKPFETQNDIDDIRLVPDQAVPLSLLLAEALTNAIKHGSATRDDPGQLCVRLKRSGGSDALLEVANSMTSAAAAAAATGAAVSGLGSQLVMAFVQQLGGQQETGVRDGKYYLRVTFALTPLSLAENRQAAQVSDDGRGNASRP
jgi:two-component system, sensor histidine kinase PdtaS